MILLVQSYAGGNDAFERHYPYFLKAGANRIVGIGTLDGNCKFPPSCEHTIIGHDSYINGSALPQRLLDTIKWGLKQGEDHILISEYDTLFFNHIRYQAMEHTVASHLAGGPTWGSKAKAFYHNCWLFHREFAEKFIEEGNKVIAEGLCSRERGEASSPESSPDVFFGLVCERLGQTVQTDLWKEYSRNDLSLDGHLDEARKAYNDGVDVLHGIKTKWELKYILS